ncbi:hypothetical protein AB4Z54_38705, partial [Streptomyces sp. MCAF7]
MSIATTDTAPASRRSPTGSPTGSAPAGNETALRAGALRTRARRPPYAPPPRPACAAAASPW